MFLNNLIDEFFKWLKSKPDEGVSSAPPDNDLDTMREVPTPEEESEHLFTKTFKF